MNKIKIWSMMLLVAMTLPMMVACGSDNDGGPSGDDLIKRAIGRWMCTESTDIQAGKTMTGLMVGKQISIKDDHTYTSTSSSFGYSGTYTVNGNTITAKSSKGATFVVNVKIQGDKMIWDRAANNRVSVNYTFAWLGDNSNDDDAGAVTPPSYGN